jgi:glycine/D-amino acid oxidase-like deaminating enzyme
LEKNYEQVSQTIPQFWKVGLNRFIHLRKTITKNACVCFMIFRWFPGILALALQVGSLRMSSLLSGKNIVVVGGGFAGLSTILRLKGKPVKSITLFDTVPIGQAGASSVAGGLMHPLSPRGMLLWKGLESYHSSKAQFDKVETVSRIAVTNKNMRLVRPCLTKTAEELWKKASLELPDWVEPLEAEDLEKIYDTSKNEIKAAYLIKNALVVNSRRYLEALWHTIKEDDPRISVSCEEISDLRQLSSHYDLVIVAAGAGSPRLWSGTDPTYQFDVKYVGGSNLLFHNEPSLSDALLSGEYIVPLYEDNQQLLLAGASHDHLQHDFGMYDDSKLKHFKFDQLEISLLSKVQAVYPPLRSLKPISTSSGVRLVTKRTALGRPPIAGRHHIYANVWGLFGLGGRGLLYHSLLSELLVEAMDIDSESRLPDQLLPTAHYRHYCGP